MGLPEQAARASAADADRIGTVFNVQRCSFHDGPGIRTTVFLKGCPLRCSWCHNPEGIVAGRQILFDPGRCLGCGGCREICSRPAGPLAPGERVGERGCTGCESCASACPSGARSIAGRSWSVREVVAEARRDLAVYEESGGGVTFSGGEPMMQPEFLCACLEACRKEGIATAVDTCGFAPRDVVLSVAARADLLLWDLKHLDPVLHRELTGAPLEPILANLWALAGAGPPIWLRFPVIPGHNDGAANVTEVARLAAAHPSIRRVSLLPYHRIGLGKLPRLGLERGGHRGSGDLGVEGLTAPQPDRMEELRALFAGAGKETTIGG